MSRNDKAIKAHAQKHTYAALKIISFWTRLEKVCVGEPAGVAQPRLKLGQHKRHLTAQLLQAKAASLALASRFPSDHAELGYYIRTAPGEKHNSVQNLQRCSVEFP